MLHFTFQNMSAFYGPWPRGLGLSHPVTELFCSLFTVLDDLSITVVFSKLFLAEPDSGPSWYPVQSKYVAKFASLLLAEEGEAAVLCVQLLYCLPQRYISLIPLSL